MFFKTDHVFIHINTLITAIIPNRILRYHILVYVRWMNTIGQLNIQSDQIEAIYETFTTINRCI